MRRRPAFDLVRKSAVALGLGLLCALAGLAPAAPKPDAAPAAREPELRHLDRRKDRADAERIWTFRKKLPEKFYRRSNFAWATADIAGLEKKEYFAHSGIQGFDGLSSSAARRIKGISLSPEKGQGRFETLFVDYKGNVGGPDAIPRYFDTEYKILEDLAARLPDSGAAGTVRLYTYLEPCPSCRGVMRQFLAVYTNVQMLVLYSWP
jgi:hypothetical protein